jgi:hypothetical protein
MSPPLRRKKKLQQMRQRLQLHQQLLQRKLLQLQRHQEDLDRSV